MNSWRDILIKCVISLALACGIGGAPLGLIARESGGASADARAAELFGASAAFAAPTDIGRPMTELQRNVATRKIPSVDNLPSTFSLTNIDQITPVKLQNPWGDCWAFAVASALESSILKRQAVEEAAAEVATETAAGSAAETADKTSETTPSPNGGTAGQGNNATEKTSETTPSPSSEAKLLNLNASVDLSERALAWFIHEPQTEATAGAQAGEGFALKNPDDKLNQLTMGNFKMIATLLIAGQGLISEEAAPYQYNDYKANPKWFKLGDYDGARNDARMKDWSLPSELINNTDLGWSVTDVFELTSPANYNVDDKTGDTFYIDYNPNGTKEIKEALLDVGAVAVAIDAENVVPSDIAEGNFATVESGEHFSYKNWAQYNAKNKVDFNHAVTIVGWDDNYPASNFNGTVSGRPQENGAWLCKNNWGSDAYYKSIGADGDSSHWGLRADSKTGVATDSNAHNSEASGFFWISYYDHSLQDPTAFAVSPKSEAYANRYQYDYLGASEIECPSTFSNEFWVGNVFTAKGSELLHAISAQTYMPNDVVEAKIYMLPSLPSLPSGEIPTTESMKELRLVAESHASFAVPGFHTIKLDRGVLLNPGEKFLVATSTQKTTNESDRSYFNIEVSFPSNFGDYFSSDAIKNPGESFVSFHEDEWIPLDETNELFNERIKTQMTFGIAFGNALVKAYTNPSSMSMRKQIYETAKLNVTKEYEDKEWIREVEKTARKIGRQMNNDLREIMDVVLQLFSL